MLECIADTEDKHYFMTFDFSCICEWGYFEHIATMFFVGIE